MDQTAKRDAGKLTGEYSAEFDRLRQARVNVSFYKYGPARKNFGEGRVESNVNHELLTIEELNLQPGEYAVCLAKRNPFSGWYPMVIERVQNGYVCPALEQYVTEILGGFRIPNLRKAEEAQK